MLCQVGQGDGEWGGGDDGVHVDAAWAAVDISATDTNGICIRNSKLGWRVLYSNAKPTLGQRNGVGRVQRCHRRMWLPSTPIYS